MVMDNEAVSIDVAPAKPVIPLAFFRLHPTWLEFYAPRGARCSATTLVLALAILSLSPFFLRGCQSSPALYVAPRITGRVLDAHSGQPLAQVTVRRLGEEQNLSRMEPRHGGQALQQSPAVRTDAQGAFVLESARALTPFRNTGWYVVYVAFEVEGYQSKVIEYSLANVTNNFKGEPVVNAGDIRLLRGKP
jgi:hypothetical protein